MLAMLGIQRLSWEQGVAAEAVLDLGRYELVRVLAREAVTRQAPDGRLAEVGEGNLVDAAAKAEAVGCESSSQVRDPPPSLACASVSRATSRYVARSTPRPRTTCGPPHRFTVEHDPWERRERCRSARSTDE